MIQPMGPSRTPEPETPRQEATRLEARIRDHAEAASEWAEKAAGMAPRPCQRDGTDNAHAFASITQAHAAAAQALALLRPRLTG